jgi:hypothetical protein
MPDIFIGFDGFVDHLYHAVLKRMDRKAYLPFPTLKEFGGKIEEASFKSCNIESVLLHSGLGGNAPLVTLGLSSFDVSINLVGCLGYPSIHPLFNPLQKENVVLNSIGEPGTTLAYEFNDGKLLLGTMNDVLRLSFEECLSRYPDFLKILEKAAFLVTLNWTMSPMVQEFWFYLLKQPKAMFAEHSLFIDFADPRKRPTEDLVQGIAMIQELSERMNCYISLNLSEADALLSAFNEKTTSNLEEKAFILSERMPKTTLYIHTAREVLGITTMAMERLQVPYTEKPFRLTGAGDMFNAGLLAALCENLNLRNQLIKGLATSGIWIRKGIPGSKKEVLRFESLYDHSFEAIEQEFQPAAQ